MTTCSSRIQSFNEFILQNSLTGNGSGGLKRKTGSNSNTSGGGTGSGSNQNRNQNAKNSKNQKPNSGESKGLAGGTITNINTNLKTIRTGALSKVCCLPKS